MHQNDHTHNIFKYCSLNGSESLFSPVNYIINDSKVNKSLPLTLLTKLNSEL